MTQDCIIRADRGYSILNSRGSPQFHSAGLGPVFERVSSFMPYPPFYADWPNGAFVYNGIAYPSFTAWLAAGGGTFTRATTKMVRNASNVLASVASGSLAVEYDQSGNIIGPLIEESRINLALRSEEFDNASWAKANATVTANAVAAPDGATTADKVVEAANNAVHSVVQSITWTSGSTYVISVFAKAAERSAFEITVSAASFGTGFVGRFTLSGAGTTTQVTGTPTLGIESLPNGWYRCYMIATATATGATGATFRLYNAASTYLGDGASGLYLWGAQVEDNASSGPSSYIPTTTVTVQRNADVLSFPWTETTGTFLAVTKNVLFGGATERVIGFNTGASALRKGAATSVSTNSGASVLTKAGLSGTWLSQRKTAVAGDASGRSITGNGAAVSSDANAFLSSTPATVYIGSQNGTSALNGNFQIFAAWPGIKLTDAHLISYTT